MFPAERLLIVVVEPVPVNAPGLIVQLPDGKPVNSTLPVGTVHVGCVIVPTIGAVGADGAALIVTEVAAEIHPAPFLTVTLYVADGTLLNTPVVFV